MWNKLHSDLKNSTTVNMFKKGIKPFLLVSMKQRNSSLKLLSVIFFYVVICFTLFTTIK